MKDDYLIDPVTGKPPVEPECRAWLFEDREESDVFFEDNKLVIKNQSGAILYDLPVEKIEDVDIGQMQRSSFGEMAAGFVLFGWLGGALASSEDVPALKITYLSEGGLTRKITLVTIRAGDLVRKIDSLRASLQLPRSTRQKQESDLKTIREREIIREKEVIVKIRCPYCAKLYEEGSNVCPHCGGKR